MSLSVSTPTMPNQNATPANQPANASGPQFSLGATGQADPMRSPTQRAVEYQQESAAASMMMQSASEMMRSSAMSAPSAAPARNSDQTGGRVI